MPRTDKSIGILTGMIIAALYVILLVGFTREILHVAGILHAAGRSEPHRRARAARRRPRMVQNRSAAQTCRFARRCLPTRANGRVAWPRSMPSGDLVSEPRGAADAWNGSGARWASNP